MLKSRKLPRTNTSKTTLLAGFFYLTGLCLSFAAGPPPVITVQPSDQTVLLSNTTTFAVEATSSTTLSYQWRKNGVNIAGATQSSYTIASVSSVDAADYSVRLVNGGGSVTSASAKLTVLTPPVITGSPQNQTGVLGKNVTFSVAATGAAPLSYRWHFNDSPLPSATNSTLLITNVQSGHLGQYRVVVTNFMGSATSSVATLILQSAPIKNNGSKDEHDYLQATIVDDKGNVYVTGYAENDKEHDYVTLKYDPQGNLLWKANYNGPADKNDQARLLAVDAGGNVYVSGSSEGSSSSWDYATVKYDSNGNQLWASRYNGTANKEDLVSGMAVDANGNVFVTGASKGSGDRYNYVTIKYNSAGSQAWLGRYIGPLSLVSEDQATSLALDSAGNVYVTGKSRALLSGFDYATVKYSHNGAELWAIRYSGDLLKDDVAVKVVTDAAGNVYVTGTTAGLLGSVDYATIKYNSNGARQWITTYNGPANRIDQPVDLVLDKAGNILVTGSSEVTAGKSDFATVKYNNSGQQIWAKRYNGPASGDDQASALAVDPVGDIWVTGVSDGFGTGRDFASIKYRSLDGAELLVSRFNSSDINDDAATALAIDNEFNVYVGGQAFDKLDYTLLKYQSGPYQPMILAQPASQMVNPGQPVTFNVTAAGTGPLSYQWTHNGLVLPNESRSSLTLDSVQASNAGSYGVTIANSAGSVSSAASTLTVKNTLHVPQSAGTGSNGFSFQVSMVPGSTYVIMASTNCVDWFPIATNIAQNANFVFTDRTPGSSSSNLRFYRLMVRD